MTVTTPKELIEQAIRQGYNAVTIANAIGVSETLISLIRKGRKNLSSGNVIKIARLIGVDPSPVLTTMARGNGTITIPVKGMSPESLDALVKLAVAS